MARLPLVRRHLLLPRFFAADIRFLSIGPDQRIIKIESLRPISYSPAGSAPCGNSHALLVGLEAVPADVSGTKQASGQYDFASSCIEGWRDRICWPECVHDDIWLVSFNLKKTRRCN